MSLIKSPECDGSGLSPVTLAGRDLAGFFGMNAYAKPSPAGSRSVKPRLAQLA